MLLLVFCNCNITQHKGITSIEIASKNGLDK